MRPCPPLPAVDLTDAVRAFLAQPLIAIDRLARRGRRAPPGRGLVPARRRRPDPPQLRRRPPLVREPRARRRGSRSRSSTPTTATAGSGSTGVGRGGRRRTSSGRADDIVALAHRYHPEGPTRVVDRAVPPPAAGHVPPPDHRRPRPPRGRLTWRPMRRHRPVRIGFQLWPQTADWPAHPRRGARAPSRRAGASLWTWDHLLRSSGRGSSRSSRAGRCSPAGRR